MAAYGLGADDYVRKSFGAAERAGRGPSTPSRAPAALARPPFGEVRIDLGARPAVGGGGRAAHAHSSTPSVSTSPATPGRS